MSVLRVKADIFFLAFISVPESYTTGFPNRKQTHVFLLLDAQFSLALS